MHGRIFNAVAGACEVSLVHDAGNPWLRRGLGIVAQVLGQNPGVEHSVSNNRLYQFRSLKENNVNGLIRIVRHFDLSRF